MKVVRVECELSCGEREVVLMQVGVLDSVERGMKLSEAGYGVIEDPVGPLETARKKELILSSRRSACSRRWE